MYNADDALSNWSIRIGRNKVDSIKSANSKTTAWFSAELQFPFFSTSEILCAAKRYKNTSYFLSPIELKCNCVFV